MDAPFTKLRMAFSFCRSATLCRHFYSYHCRASHFSFPRSCVVTRTVYFPLVVIHSFGGSGYSHPRARYFLCQQQQRKYPKKMPPLTTCPAGKPQFPTLPTRRFNSHPCSTNLTSLPWLVPLSKLKSEAGRKGIQSHKQNQDQKKVKHPVIVVSSGKINSCLK